MIVFSAMRIPEKAAFRDAFNLSVSCMPFLLLLVYKSLVAGAYSLRQIYLSIYIDDNQFRRIVDPGREQLAVTESRADDQGLLFV